MVLFPWIQALLVFLRKVVSHQDQNRMSLWNVSMVMAPNLFACRHHSNKRSIARQREEMEEAVGGAHLVRLMITHQDLLWIVSDITVSPCDITVSDLLSVTSLPAVCDRSPTSCCLR